MDSLSIDRDPNLSTLFAILSKEKPDIESITLNVYQWGSRVYGNTTEESDWDFILIVKDEPELASSAAAPSHPNDSGKHKITQREPKRNVDEMEKRFRVFELHRVNGMLVPLSDFRAMLMEHRHEALECIYLPQKNVWLEKVKFGPIKIDFDVLRRTIGWESKRRFTGATHSAETDSFKKGKKEILHSIRYIMFAKQLVEKGCIYDYAAANELWRQMQAETAPDWAFFVEKYGAVRHEVSLSFSSMKSLSRFYSRVDTKVAILNTLRSDGRFSSNPDAQSTQVNASGTQSVSDDVHSKLECVRFIRAHGLDALQRQHKVSVLRHTEHKNLVFLATHQFEPLTSSLERECFNGVILDESNNFSVVSYSFPEIPHLHDSTHPPVRLDPLQDWEIEEKVDGTFVCMYYYNGRWEIATRLEPNNPQMKLSFLPIMDVNRDRTVADHFWKTWKDKGYSLPEDTSCCYVFELLYFHHRYIVKYPDDDIILISIRNTATLEEVQPQALPLRIARPKRFSHLSSLSQVEDFVHLMSPFEYKGLVLRNRTTFQRVQLLNKLYIAVAYAGDLTTIGSLNLDGDLDYVHMFDICKNGLAKKFVLYWPEWADFAQTVGAPYDAYCRELTLLYDKIRDIESEAEFSTHAKKSFLQTILFKMRKFACGSPREFLSLMAAHHRAFAKHWKEFQAHLKRNSPDLLILQTPKQHI